MKKVLVSLFAVSALLFSASFAIAADAVYKMNMTTQYMDKHPVVQKIYLSWAEAIKQKTGGRVEITYFNPGTICPEGEIFDSLKKGQINIGSHFSTRNPGKLNLLGVFAVPSSLTTSTDASAAVWRFLQTTPAAMEEFKGIKVLTIHSSASAHFAFAKGEVKNFDDMKGKKMLAPSGPGARLLRAVGANPITVPFTDFYLSLQRGMADGCLTPIAPMRSFKINETTKSITLCSLTYGTIWLGMNQELWDSLPADIQAAFEEVSGETMSRQIGGLLDATDKAELKTMQDNGIVVNTLAPEERAKFINAASPVAIEGWEAIMKGSKADPKAILAHYNKICDELAAGK